MIKLEPVYKTSLWGGTKIRDVLHKDTAGLETIAESWELSTHPNGRSLISGGEFGGMTLREYFGAVGWEQAGEYAARHHDLPIMIKYIDAHENLSIQVHPTEQYAQFHGSDAGKNEFWYVLDADEGAFLYLGFCRDVTRAEVCEAIAHKTIEQLLNKIPVKKGEIYYVPAGTVHAIGAGCLICELQQTSDATYRLYDYDRIDKDGKPRPLHLEDGLATLDYRQLLLPQKKQQSRIRNMLGEMGKLTFSEYNAEGEAVFFSPETKLLTVLVLEGSGSLDDGERVQAKSGDTFVITAHSVKLNGKFHALIIGI